jgi:2'-5' RNA ligase
MRLFVGIPLANELTSELETFIGQLRAPDDQLRWSAPAGWHITLQFLGSASSEQCECVKSQLATLRPPRFPIQLVSPGFFDRAGVFFVGVAVSPDLAALQSRVVDATQACGFSSEDRPYHPHITLARAKRSGSTLTRLKARLRSQPRFSGFIAREFLLYESFPDPCGSRYEVRGSFSF